MRRVATAIATLLIVPTLVAGCTGLPAKTPSASSGVSTSSGAAGNTGASGNSGASSSSGGSQAAQSTPRSDAIKADQVPISVAKTVMEGKDLVGVSFTNNTDYEIAGLSIQYAFKDGVDEGKVKKMFREPLKNQYISADDILDYDKNVSIETPTKPGETSITMPVNIVGSYYMTDMDQYDLLEPESMTIVYLANNTKVYFETYSFESDSYGLSSTVKDTTEWGQSSAAKALPRCDAGLQVSTNEYESIGSFQADYLNVTKDEFNAYVKKVKDAGYTNDPTSADSYYIAKDANGTYEVSVYYTPYTKKLSAHISTE